MKLKNFIFSALALASMTTFANEDKNAKLKQINQEIQALQKGLFAHFCKILIIVWLF